MNPRVDMSSQSPEDRSSLSTRATGAGAAKRAPAPFVSRTNKYRAVAFKTPDGRFSSQSEYRRWCELKILAKTGEIHGLRRQVVYPLIIGNARVLIRSKGFPNGRAAKYTADFVYIENGKEVIEEHKGHDDEAARLRRAIVEAIYGCRILLTKAH